MMKINYLISQAGSTLKLRALTTPVEDEVTGREALPEIGTTETAEIEEEDFKVSIVDVDSIEAITTEKGNMLI